MKKKSILIIGGTGFIGTNLTKKVLKLGWDVTCLSLIKKNNYIVHKNLKYIYLFFGTVFNLIQPFFRHLFTYKLDRPTDIPSCFDIFLCE